MTSLELARLQFGVVTIFHFFFVPVTIGMAVFVATCQTLQHRTGRRWVQVASNQFRLNRKSRRTVFFHYVGTSVRNGSATGKFHGGVTSVMGRGTALTPCTCSKARALAA